MFYGMGDGLAEWVITTPGGAQLLLQMAYFDRGRQPVLMEIGPVLDLDDAIGSKVAALATRAAERDYLDVAAALARGYTVARRLPQPRARPSRARPAQRRPIRARRRTRVTPRRRGTR